MFSLIPDRAFRIACIGGSAGATQIYANIFRNLPFDTGLAFVVVPHRSIQNPSGLVKFLALNTRMSITTMTDGMVMEPNSVFVTPPGVHVQLDGIHLLLNRFISWGWPTTLSCFLNSLADSHGPPSAAVVLSGLGNDGSSALAAIKNDGGATFAQSDPQWPSMPDCAVATGNVDFILNASGIARTLTDFARQAQPKITLLAHRLKLAQLASGLGK